MPPAPNTLFCRRTMKMENFVLIVFAGAALAFGHLVFCFFKGQKAAPDRSPSWRRLIAGNMLILLFLVALFLTCGEVYYRFIYDGTDAYMLSKTSRRWLHRHYHLNGSEARDSIEYLWKIQPGMRRITFLGDSFTVGHGIKNVEDRFANLIRNRRPDWEVHVLAQNGLETGNHLGLIGKQLRSSYEFDTVVLVYVLNDISDLATDYWLRAMDRVTQSWKLSPFLGESYFVNTWYYRLRIVLDPDLKDYFHFVKDWYQQSLWETEEQRLRLLHEIISRRGGRMMVVTFPFMQSAGDAYPFREIHAQLDTFWRGLNVPHLDLSDTLLRHPARKLVVNRFDAHPNERAHALAAEAIEEFIQSRMPGP